MKRREIDRLLKDNLTYQKCDSIFKTAFAREMRRRCYGFDPLTQAFWFFLYGWMARLGERDHPDWQYHVNVQTRKRSQQETIR